MLAFLDAVVVEVGMVGGEAAELDVAALTLRLFFTALLLLLLLTVGLVLLLVVLLLLLLLHGLLPVVLDSKASMLNDFRPSITRRQAVAVEGKSK